MKEGPGAPDSRARFASLSTRSAAVLLGGYSLNMFNPIESPYAGPSTRLGFATVAIWHNADHYGQMIIYLRLRGIVPQPAAGIHPRSKTITEILRRFLHVHKRTISSSCTFTYNN